MGVQGVSEYEREALILSSSLGASQGELARRAKRRWPGPLASFWASRKKLDARRRRTPPPQKTTEAARRVVAQASLSCPYGAIHLLAPYEVAETCPLIRPFGATFPYPLCRCATSPLDKGSRPPREKA